VDIYIGGGIRLDGSWLGWLIVGALAGWIAGNLYRGRGYGCLGNTVLGIVGAIVGGWLFRQLGIGGNLFNGIGSIIVATVGAFVVIFIADLFGGSKGRGRGRPYR